ncbi:MAG: dihydropteroate synthase [Alphaproteobacteria bacterium]|nr:dihydropteroate synthase [Alphaproteobacteria bacterium]
MNTPRIMGIINVTPDSFSGDGILRDDYVTQAVARAEQMAEEGATILDIGGESTRPGAMPVSADEEIRRVVPVIAAIKSRLNLPLSIDTFKPETADAACRAGAGIVNDINGLSDPAMRRVAVRHRASVVIMHNRAKPDAVTHDATVGGQYDAGDYGDIAQDVARELSVAAENAMRDGVARDKIIVDPGIGFGKSVAQNLALIAHIGTVKALGFPVLMGVSRKSFIGYVMGATVDDRLEGTAAAVTACVLNGADILRVHDVKFMARVARMAAAIRDA